MKTSTLTLIGAIAVLGIAVADAQTYPGRGERRGGTTPREAERDRQRDAPRSISALQEPFAALERELPSLNVDIRLRADQLDDWRIFERDVRDIAEIERTRRKHLMALRDEGAKPPTALTLIGSLVEDDRLKAEAAQDMKRHFEALYAKLDDAQRRTLDRRLLQSQTEPLGLNAERKP